MFYYEFETERFLLYFWNADQRKWRTSETEDKLLAERGPHHSHSGVRKCHQPDDGTNGEVGGSWVPGTASHHRTATARVLPGDLRQSEGDSGVHQKCRQSSSESDSGTRHQFAEDQRSQNEYAQRIIASERKGKVCWFGDSYQCAEPRDSQRSPFRGFQRGY